MTRRFIMFLKWVFGFGLTLLLVAPVQAETLTPVAIVCPCTFEPQNQTYSLANFSVVFNDEIDASEPIDVAFSMLEDLDPTAWTSRIAVRLPSLPYSREPQAVQLRFPSYLYRSVTGYPSLTFSSVDSTPALYDLVILSIQKQTIAQTSDYGLLDSDEAALMFLSEPTFSVSNDVATLKVDQLFAPALSNKSETLEFIVSVGPGISSFYVKGSASQSVTYNAEGIAAIDLTIALDEALDNHLSRDETYTEIQIQVNRNESEVMFYWVGSLAEIKTPPALGRSFSAPDALNDTDADGISDFNEALLGSDPAVQDAREAVELEVVYTYGSTVKAEYGAEFDARMVLLQEVANLAFTESGVPVRVVGLAQIDVGDDSGLTAETLIDQMKQRSGLFASLNEKLTRKPDLMIHLGMGDVINTGGLANLQGGLAAGIIDRMNAFNGGKNVGVVALDNDELTLPHEIGHLMGLAHSRVQGDADGAFPWSRGYGVSGDFVTIMAYPTAFADAAALGFFSTPDLTCREGPMLCGVARADYLNGANAALTLNTTAYQIAAISNGFSPVLTVVGANPAVVTSEAAIAALSVKAVDAEDGDLTSQIKTTLAAAPTGATGYTHLYTYSVTDGDQNTQSTSRKINLVLTTTDSDDDGVTDDQDAFPNDPAETLDSDDDGVGDNADAFPNDARETLDTDGDGVGNNNDAFPNNPAESSDTDGDKVGDKADAFPTNSAETVDTDGDGTGNNADPDDDDDGFSDADEVAAGTDPLSASSCPGCFSFDIDDDGEAKALTDGLLVIRHLFGFSGEALTAGAVGSDAKRSTPADIAAYLTNAATELDIDGDDEAKALIDGLLLIRYLFGFSGDSLTAGAVGLNANRGSAEDIETYIEQRTPGQ